MSPPRSFSQARPPRDSWLFLLVVLAVATPLAAADVIDKVPDFHKQIEPILSEYCYECHGVGEKKGQIAFDELKTDEQLLHSPELWWKVLRNVRSNIMPPEKNPRPSDAEKRLLADWIKYRAFGSNPQSLDPGRVTLRRLNRVEYSNTIRDLVGYDFKANEEFPADDTGYGFDNIGDVLTVSPLLLEKYVNAAEAIVAAAVPTVPKAVEEETIASAQFKDANGKIRGDALSFYTPAEVSHKFQTKQAGDYKVHVDLQVKGQFSFDPGRCRVIFRVDGQECLNHEYSWENSKKFEYAVDERLSQGEHQFSLELQPLTPVDKKINSLNLQMLSVRVEGPLDPQFWTRTKNYDRFFSKENPPEDGGERRRYAQAIIARFVKQAFRRPVDEPTIERLVTLAEEYYNHPGKRFEEGIQRAFVAALASPYFLFRVEQTDPAQANERYPSVDEYSLASRLSYFLWSSMPDAELIGLADQGALRKNLPAQVQRMLKDPRSQGLIENFIGQWLQVRDVEGIAIDEQVVTARDNAAFRKLVEAVDNIQNEFVRRTLETLLEIRQELFKLDGPLRKAMQQEAEMLFAFIVQEDRDLLELVDCDYTFVNRLLARYYGLPAPKEDGMQRVMLAKDSSRGGVLTMAAVLVVTSNPDRTSPVKRGLFILDNILGAPPPPPPANVPALEVAEKAVRGHVPTMRESLEIHRSRPLCSSCHSRMDPLGLGFENFNALGRWRFNERGAPIDARGELSTGETFQNVRDLKQIISKQHHEEFYRCFTEKLFTYALGRGLTYDDVYQVDELVDRLERGDGRFSLLLTGIIESPQFQKRRNLATPVADQSSRQR